MQGATAREVKPEDIGWLAGIIDGEGSILFNKPSKDSFNQILYGIYIVGADLSLLNKCRKILDQLIDGEGKKYHFYKKNYKKGLVKSNKQTYCIQIGRQHSIRKVLEVILPHLTEKYLKSARLLNFLQKHTPRKWFREGEVESYFGFTPVETK